MRKNYEIDATRKGLSPREAANVVGISTSLMHKLIQSGEIPAIKLGGKRWVIPVAALDAMLREAIQA